MMLFLAFACPPNDSVSIEWRLDGAYGIARYHPDGGYGDPWERSAIVEPMSPNALILASEGDRFTPRMLTLLDRQLRTDRPDITGDLFYERRNRNAPRLVTVKRRAQIKECTT